MTRTLTPEICIFWDVSNIFHPARLVASRFKEGQVDYRVRIHFPRVYEVARAGRDVTEAYAVGPRPEEKFWDHLEPLGITTERFDTHHSGEQGVDQALQVRMLRTLVDNPIPGTAVLLTGDGAGYNEGVGFYSDLERMHKRGWGVEVISWEASCNRYLRAWAENVGEFIGLERYYHQITFVEGGRTVRDLSLKGRRRALPGTAHHAA